VKLFGGVEILSSSKWVVSSVGSVGRSTIAAVHARNHLTIRRRTRTTLRVQLEISPKQENAITMVVAQNASGRAIPLTVRARTCRTQAEVHTSSVHHSHLSGRQPMRCLVKVPMQPTQNVIGMKCLDLLGFNIGFCL